MRWSEVATSRGLWVCCHCWQEIILPATDRQLPVTLSPPSFSAVHSSQPHPSETKQCRPAVSETRVLLSCTCVGPMAMSTSHVTVWEFFALAPRFQWWFNPGLQLLPSSSALEGVNSQVMAKLFLAILAKLQSLQRSCIHQVPLCSHQVQKQHQTS